MYDDKEWLASLKPGDEVIISGRYGDDLRKVHRRTPSGRIIVSVGGMSTVEFNADGYERGRHDGFYRTHLVEPTQQRRDEIERKALAGKIDRAKLVNLSLDKLRKIAELLEQ